MRVDVSGLERGEDLFDGVGVLLGLVPVVARLERRRFVILHQVAHVVVGGDVLVLGGGGGGFTPRGCLARDDLDGDGFHEFSSL